MVREQEERTERKQLAICVFTLPSFGGRPVRTPPELLEVPDLAGHSMTRQPAGTWLVRGELLADQLGDAAEILTRFSGVVAAGRAVVIEGEVREVDSPIRAEDG